MSNTRIKSIHFFRMLRIFFVMSGIIFLGAVVLSFTTLPFWGIYWLGTSKSGFNSTPQTIILLGGSGMPGESNLIRCWYAAQAAENFPRAKIIISIPGDTADLMSTPQLIKKELILHGVRSSQISFESIGTNTRAQALLCSGILDTTRAILLVTSPDHVRRAVLCFQKTGFRKVNALPAFENTLQADLKFRDDELGGRKSIAPDVGQSIQIRYQVWNHLKYEIMFIREILALGYYKLRGWI